MTETMTAMLLERAGEGLRASTRAVPEPGSGQILVRVHACGVCRTDLHVVDGDLPDPTLPVVTGPNRSSQRSAIHDGSDRA